MSAPVVGAVGLASTIFGGIKQAQGAEAMGQAQSSMYSYQAGLAEINKQIALQNATYSRNTGEIQAQKYGMGASQRQGQIVSGQASSGLDVNSGSNARVQDSNKIVTRMDLDQIRSNAAKTAYDYEVTATQQGGQEDLYKMAASNATAAAKINVESSYLGTASSVSSKWLQASQLGMFSGSGGGGPSATPSDPLTQWSLGR